VSWVHEIDFARVINFILDHDHLNGSINICIPKPNTNYTLMKTLRKVMKIPFGISQPKILLKMGAKIIGTEVELILKIET